jgi:hypothetical protein
MARSTKIFITILILMILIPITIQVIKKYNRYKYARYTIGITNGIYSTGKGSHRVYFYMYLYNKRITREDTYTFNEGEKSVNGRYFVRFDSLHPSNAVLLQDFQVPDSIKTAPPNGWKEIPVKRPEN